MIRGLYTSGWSMLANTKKMDVISNNLANAATNAYKKDSLIFESFPSVLTKRLNDTRSRLNPSGTVGSMELGNDVGEVYTYYNQGQLVKTDNKTDLAINGTGAAFFAVEVPQQGGEGKEYYTRDGAFVLSSEGQLMTGDGYAVVGENGPIFLKGDNFDVQDDGTIIQDGQRIGKLKIVEFNDTTALKKYGSNLVQADEGTEAKDFTGTVVQGYVEQSNVNIVREMVDMISVMRAYEANQKVLQAEDGTLEKAVNEVGTLR